MKDTLIKIGLLVLTFAFIAYSMYSIGISMKKSADNEKELLRLEKQKILLEIKILKNECCC